MRSKLTKFALAAGIMLALALTFSCSLGSDDNEDVGSSCNINGRTIEIGSQTWMAENLNCNVSGSKCYNNSEANCNKFGRLYDWKTAKTVCPSGWHLPSDADWTTLTDFVGGASTAGIKLKATSGWDNNGNGTDNFGFSALPGGYGDRYDYFPVSYDGYWWSASEDNAYNGSSQHISYDNERTFLVGSDKTSLLSVRCVKNRR